jgi:hypothetical protein
MESGCRRRLRACLTSLGKLTSFILVLESYANACWCSMISYPNYKFIFPIKALGMYAKRFGNEKIL